MSVTKNPMIMQSAAFIYSWFISRINDTNTLQNMNLLEQTTSDASVVKFLKKRMAREKYQNKEERDNRLKEMIENVNL